jgi:hypothetical protein
MMRKLDINSSERKKLMLGSLVYGKEKPDAWQLAIDSSKRKD